MECNRRGRARKGKKPQSSPFLFVSATGKQGFFPWWFPPVGSFDFCGLLLLFLKKKN
jgi:hypothetical protein